MRASTHMVFAAMTPVGRCRVALVASAIPVCAAGAAPSDETGLKAEYVEGTEFSAPKVTRVDRAVDFAWGASAPDPALKPGVFSVRWTGQIEPRYSETYTFFTLSDGAVRLWVEGRCVLHHVPDRDAGSENASGRVDVMAADAPLAAGQRVEIRLDFAKVGGEATVQLGWSSPSQRKEIVPTGCLFPVTPAPVERTDGGEGAIPGAGASNDPALRAPAAASVGTADDRTGRQGGVAAIGSSAGLQERTREEGAGDLDAAETQESARLRVEQTARRLAEERSRRPAEERTRTSRACDCGLFTECGCCTTRQCSCR